MHFKATHNLSRQVAVLLTVAVPGLAGAGTTWYVDDDATPGDGTGWETAFSELQSALAVAQTGDEIRLAQGIYRPDYDRVAGVHNGDRTATFTLVNGTSITGGWAGVTEPLPDARDIGLYVTRLSGDLAGNDGPGFVGYGENSFHVVTAGGTDPSTVLAGVSITGGNADGEGLPTLCFGGPDSGQPCGDNADCQGAECVSLDSTGAGLIAFTGRATLLDCTIAGNIAAFQGGGMLLKAGSDMTITGCVFTGNRALDNGGAMYCGFSSPSITGCTFSGNSGVRYAGAICNRDLSNSIITDCLFTGNTAAENATTGGGAIVNASSSPSITGCTFDRNVSILGVAGALYNKVGFDPALGSSDPLVEDCTFTNNTAVTGGAVYNDLSSPTFSGCSFEANDATAGEGGGAMWNNGGSTVLTGCTFTANLGFNGGAVYNGGGADILIVECAFTGNAAINDNGGAVSNVISGGMMLGCTFIDNTVSGTGFVTGGAVNNYFANPSVIDCVFIGNSADFGGGGLYNESGGEGGPLVARCTFIENTAPYGAGMYNFWSHPTVTSCLFADNTASLWGGGIYNDFGSSPSVSHCTIVGNTAGRGGGVNSENVLGVPEISHCIIWGNSPQQMTDDVESPSTVSWTNIQGGWPAGRTNMNEDPGFADPAGGDYRLLRGSACVDAGDPNLAVDPRETDLAGNPRLADGDGDGTPVPDLGAYELQPCPGDIDGDGSVGINDVLELLAAWGPNPGHPADLDGDGAVEFDDFVLLLEDWGPCPA